MIWNPDCQGPCDCPGEEQPEAFALTCPKPGCEGDARYAPPGRGHTCVTGPPESREDHLAQLAGAWAWGYAAAQRDALDQPYSDTPEAATWKPRANPYRVQVNCDEHKPVQHRDAKRPWCNTCGRAADGELIGKSKLLR